MKPTQEQVIAWALEAGIEGHRVYGGLVVHHSNGGWINIQALLERITTLAYEAGRKDENAAVEKEITKEDLEILEDEAYCILVALLAWLRARREQ